MQVSETDNMTQHAHVCVRAAVCMCVGLCVVDVDHKYPAH